MHALDHPLCEPTKDSAAGRTMVEHFALDVKAGPRDVLKQVAAAFTRIPYENLTKIIKFAEFGSAVAARRGPEEVLCDHVALGAGGTCFSLTAALLHVVRWLGFRAEPVLADRRYGPDTHCAMQVWIGERPHLVDPGYLIVRPLPLVSSGELRVPTPFNELLLSAREDGSKVDLFTLQSGRRTYRLTYRTSPVDAGEFLRAWDG
ncbi:MAG: arylamine N-acetyltransferase [Planctomycetia bacterium]|nr:arylamine N-acetyltransferase [Planctomycetia bacterium]